MKFPATPYGRDCRQVCYYYKLGVNSKKLSRIYGMKQAEVLEIIEHAGIKPMRRRKA